MENVFVQVMTGYVDAVRAAGLPYHEKRFHRNYVPVREEKLPAPHDLVRIFPGLKAMMRARRRTVRVGMRDAEESAEAELRSSLAKVNAAECDRTFLTEIAKRTYRNRMLRHEKELRRVERFLYEPKEGQITDADIARAREYPIESIIEVKRRDGFVPCIFHDEKTPSMKVFKDNHFHCYGCGEWGDAIDLTMKLDGLGFIDAVKKLVRV